MYICGMKNLLTFSTLTFALIIYMSIDACSKAKITQQTKENQTQLVENTASNDSMNKMPIQVQFHGCKAHR